jgi:hypothetical protein
MAELPIAKGKRNAEQAPYDPQPMIARVRELLEKHNESYREAALDSGLDHQAVRRILAGKRPNMITCILLADHYQVNPNEFLLLGGWPTLKTFDIQTASAENLPPEAVAVAKEIARIPNPGMRKVVTEAILTLVSKYFED